MADLYRHRWKVETGFNVLQMTLTCELSSISHPQAATFLFCMSMLAFNIRQTMFAALYAMHDQEEIDEISHFHVSKNISDKTEGGLIAFTEDQWSQLIPTTVKGIVSTLKDIARTTDLKPSRKSRREPKKQKPKRSGNVKAKHLSTAKIIGLT